MSACDLFYRRCKTVGPITLYETKVAVEQVSTLPRIRDVKTGYPDCFCEFLCPSRETPGQCLSKISYSDSGVYVDFPRSSMEIPG
jgi:hypothetical protein